MRTEKTLLQTSLRLHFFKLMNIITQKLDQGYGRLDECIQNALSNKTANHCGVVIKGHTGTGKTFFVEQYLQGFQNSHPVLKARHSQQQEGIPYAGFRHGIADFLNNTYNKDKSKFNDFALLLKEQLGEDIHLLHDYLPELDLIIDKNTAFLRKASLTIENQLYPLFKILFESLSDCFHNPVLFFTDDLQNMDGSGINLLKYLLLHLAPRKLIWIGAYRESQRNLLPINQLIESLHFNKKFIESIAVKEFSLSQGHFFMEQWLGAPCSRQLSQTCHQLSEANLSQLQVLAESLKKENLIRLKDGIWEGDYEKILEKYRGQNAYGIVRTKIEQLSLLARDMIGLFSCMGVFDRNIVLGYFQGNGQLCEACVAEALQCGLLIPEDGGFNFSENHMGEMIYQGLDEKQKSFFHYRIAKLLYQQYGDSPGFSKQVMMTGHFNQALDLIRKNGEMAFCAGLNFQAGSLYKKDQTFNQAKLHYKISADLYKECPWKKVKEQVWEVYLERAKVEYALGEYDLAEIHLDYLLNCFDNPVKRAEAYELKIIINSHFGRYRKVVSILKEGLSELGVELPLTESTLTQEIAILKSRLSQNGIVESQGDSAFSAEKQQAILQLLSSGGMGLHHTSDTLMTWAALQIIVRSEYTHSAVRGLGYVSYGRMDIIAGNIPGGYELGKRGLDLNRAQNDLQYRCRILGVFAFYIQPWQKPFLDSIPLLREGMLAGRETGDLIGLYILKTHQFNLHFISGKPLPELLHYDFEESYPGRELTYYITHYQKSLVRFLTEETAVFSVPRQQPSMMAANLTIQEERFYRNHVWARYYLLFGHHELAYQYAKEAHNNKKLQEGSPLVPANLQVIFLSITQNWPNWPEQKQSDLKRELQEIIVQMELWSHHAPMNYSAVIYLLYGEWYRLQENETAVDYYFKAIAQADTNIHLQALAHELLAKHLLNDVHQIEEGKRHLNRAIKLNNLWGATAKSRQLVQQYHFLLTDVFPKHPEMDIEAILRELSGDLKVDSLIKKLMVLLLRVSGSTSVIVEWTENNGESKGTASMTLGSSPIKNSPSGLMAMTHRTQEMFVAHDLNQENMLSEMALLGEQGVKSFIIFPVTLSESFSMTIYLDNIFAAKWYQKEKVKWIRITANHGAVVIENARTHEKTLKLNEKIQKEIAEKRLLANQIESQKDAHLNNLIETQENERKRIAGDLHDSLGSLLSGIKLRFHGLQEKVVATNPEQQLLFQDMLAQIDEAVVEVRRIAHNMSPATLRRFGLSDTLQSLIEQLNSSNQIAAELQLLGLEERLPEQLELTVYRICQELVQNVIKHAHGTSLHLQIIKHPDMLNITVEDDGWGLDIEKVTPGFGFATIETKVKLLKGNFSIESHPGKGCMAIVDIPL